MPRIQRANSVAEVKQVDAKRAMPLAGVADSDTRRSTIKRLQLEKEELKEALQRAQTALEERHNGKKARAPIDWSVLFPGDNYRTDTDKYADVCSNEKCPGNDSVSEAEESASVNSDIDVDPSSPSVHI